MDSRGVFYTVGKNLHLFQICIHSDRFLQRLLEDSQFLFFGEKRMSCVIPLLLSRGARQQVSDASSLNVIGHASHTANDIW